MDVKDALKVVYGWLSTQNVAIASYHAEVLSDSRFRVEFQQIAPEQRQRVFDVIPDGVPDVWNVVEVAA